MLSLSIALSLLLAAPSPTDRRTDADELAKTERAFSARAGVIGFRDAFIEYFAPDAIAFRPTPRIALGPLRRDPAPRTVLEWRPTVVEVSGAGDMGLSTGPVVGRVPDREGVRHFFYTSVWERQADGSWKVAIDMGTGVPDPGALADYVAPAKLGPRRAPLDAGAREKARAELLDAELAFAQAAHDAADPATAYATWLARDGRLHRDGHAPAAGREAALALLREAGPAKADWQPIAVRIAASGDFGFSYGTGEATPRGEAGKPVQTTYLHVWRRTPEGWRVIQEVLDEIAEAK
jgi:ketosteroid isomerase-like protein